MHFGEAESCNTCPRLLGLDKLEYLDNLKVICMCGVTYTYHNGIYNDTRLDSKRILARQYRDCGPHLRGDLGVSDEQLAAQQPTMLAFSSRHLTGASLHRNIKLIAWRVMFLFNPSTHV